jgi:hypothetical protein
MSNKYSKVSSETQSKTAASTPTSKSEQPSSPSTAKSSRNVSKYLASEEEHRQFAKDFPSDLVVTMRWPEPHDVAVEEEDLEQ